MDATVDRRSFWTERLASVQRDLATAREAGKRGMLVKALERERTTIEAEIAALDLAAAADGRRPSTAASESRMAGRAAASSNLQND
jgi:hypothetical protein